MRSAELVKRDDLSEEVQKRDRSVYLDISRREEAMIFNRSVLGLHFTMPARVILLRRDK